MTKRITLTAAAYVAPDTFAVKLEQEQCIMNASGSATLNNMSANGVYDDDEDF